MVSFIYIYIFFFALLSIDFFLVSPHGMLEVYKYIYIYVRFSSDWKTNIDFLILSKINFQASDVSMHEKI